MGLTSHHYTQQFIKDFNQGPQEWEADILASSRRGPYGSRPWYSIHIFSPSHHMYLMVVQNNSYKQMHLHAILSCINTN